MLVQGADGNLYGTAAGGGTNNYGTIFKITPSGKLTTPCSFCPQSACTDGEYPSAGLVQAAKGAFYGTTGSGGANGYGTVFKITPGGTLTTLYSFCAQSGYADGENPVAGLKSVAREAQARTRARDEVTLISGGNISCQATLTTTVIQSISPGRP